MCHAPTFGFLGFWIENHSKSAKQRVYLWPCFKMFFETYAQWKISLTVSLQVVFEKLNIFQTRKIRYCEQKCIKSFFYGS